MLQVGRSLEHPAAAGLLPLQHLQEQAMQLVRRRHVLIGQPLRVARNMKHHLRHLAVQREVQKQHVLFGCFRFHGVDGEELRCQIPQ
ncbi:Uncharacterised protein [Mycobacteroides abscessus subsp. abscessus]|nr:Uncharacterised protein [Mycobacteroides abscessus subsp. abscessus]